MKYLCFYILFFALALMPSDSAFAASTHTLRVSPSVSDIAIDPGASVEKRFTAVNKGDVPFELKASVAPYSVINEKYQASFEPLPGRPPVNTWITLSVPDNASLLPGKYYDVNYQVAVPASTPAGGYSAVIFTESTAAKEAGSGVVAKNRIAHIVYINVNGDVKRKGSVDVPTLPFLTLSMDQEVAYTARNEGGTNEKARVTTVIKDVFGRQVLSDSTERYVLPGTKRAMNIEWKAVGAFGIFKVESTPVFVGDSSSTTSQWVVVINPLFLLFALILVLGIVWLNFKRARTIKARHAKK